MVPNDGETTCTCVNEVEHSLDGGNAVDGICTGLCRVEAVSCVNRSRGRWGAWLVRRYWVHDDDKRLG